jgi:hypothetical protein
MKYAHHTTIVFSMHFTECMLLFAGMVLTVKGNTSPIPSILSFALKGMCFEQHALRIRIIRTIAYIAIVMIVWDKNR